MTEATVAIVGTLLTGGLITAIVTAFKARAESRKTDKEADAVGAKTPAEVESISILTMTNALNSARVINDDYKEHNETQKARNDELQQRLDAYDQRFTDMEEQRKRDRQQTHDEVEGLRRGLAAAHQYVTILLSWIEERLPGIQPPSPPSGYTENPMKAKE